MPESVFRRMARYLAATGSHALPMGIDAMTLPPPFVPGLVATPARQDEGPLPSNVVRLPVRAS